jgi:hypothetical protein
VCDVTPCSLVFTDVSEILTASVVREMAQTTRRNIPDDSRLHARRRENLKSRIMKLNGTRILMIICNIDIT